MHNSTFQHPVAPGRTVEPGRVSRRRFMGQAACAGFSLSGVLSTLGTLRLFNATLGAQTLPGNDHKALICIFLFGGNDANNMILPTDTAEYSAYAAARGILGIPQNQILPLVGADATGRSYGLHPSLSRLVPHFGSGKLAILRNVGTLVAPVTKAEYVSGGAAIPPYLFSHNDQQAQWQTSVPDSPKKIGWGGRLADLLQTLNASSEISMNISLAGNNYFQIGNEVFQYHVGTSGSIGINEYTSTGTPRMQMFQGLDENLGASYGHLFEAEYADVVNRAIANDTLLKNTLKDVPFYDRAPGTGASSQDQNLFPNARGTDGALSSLGRQLHMILRLIASRNVLSMRRQIFFCSMGGFDTHDDQINDHAYLLGQLGAAMGDFYNATATLGLSDSVTLFTASDFNRTYISNAKGSDHAWGGHQLVLGGAVNGGYYGGMPVLQARGPDDTGSRGSWIPTTSVDEYSATLARWFGVDDANLEMVLPNLGRFAQRDMGFMAGG